MYICAYITYWLLKSKKVYVPFAYRFYYRLRFHYRCACIMHFMFPLFFYSVSGSSGREYAASGSHHVRGPGLLSCAWKRVVTMWACGVKLACQTPWAAARPRSVGPWTGEASYSRGSPCRRLTVTVRYHSDSVSITVSLPCNANGT